MKIPGVVMVVIGATVAQAMVRADGGRERILLDDGWRFQVRTFPATQPFEEYKSPAMMAVLAPAQAEFAPDTITTDSLPPMESIAPEARAKPEFDDSSWRQVDLPHDWGIEGPFDPKGNGDTARLPYWGEAWYRRHLQVPASDADRSLYLQIDGAMSYSTVWLNGHLVGGWPYGYASYQVNLTPYLLVGKDNVLAIRLNNPPISSRWYPGGGIYRNVWLLRTGSIHVAHWGSYVTTPEVTPDEATVKLRLEVQWDDPMHTEPGPDGRREPRAIKDSPDTTVEVRTDIFELGRSGERAGDAVASSQALSVTFPFGSQEVEQTIKIGHPMLWSVHAPYRYVAVTTVSQHGRILDTYETPFGVRTIAFDPNRGFLLNGEPMRLQGVCDHSDLGALGSAINTRGLERQLEELQEMGCNAIRTSHNPPSPELLDLCDKMGFVVMDEAFDCWTIPKRANDYHLDFPQWHEEDLRAMIRRDRNHPCVIMWSIGNEIPEQKKPELGVRIGTELQKIVHEEDPTRPDTSACNFAGSMTSGFQNVLDVFGYNYQWMHYAEFRKAHPNQFLFGSETESTVSSRGYYAFPVDPTDKSKGLIDADHQVSSYDWSAPHWAWPPDNEFRAEDENPGVGGEFVWTGWDYLGEPTPYGKADDPSRSSYFGIIDLAGFKKDRFYLYQSRWRPDLAMAHLVPHWTWPDRMGKVTPVEVYTSGDEAELFLNGRSLGRKHKGPGEYRLVWPDVVYEPGTLKVVAYRRGQAWANDEESTAGEPAKLSAQADRMVVRANGRDLVFVTVAVEDAKGVLCPRAHPHVTFSVDGPGTVIATDNGDATSFEPFQAPAHDAFNGRVLAIVRPNANAPGTITVTAHAAGLSDSAVQVQSDAEDL